MMMYNCVFYDWNSTPYFGSFPDNSTWAFNASSGSLPPGDTGTLLTSNPFVDYNVSNNYQFGVSDLHLAAGANGDPCRDTGDPNLLDLDGTRSDMGIYGGPTFFIDSGAPFYPFVSSLTVPPSITAGQPLPVSSTGRIGREY